MTVEPTDAPDGDAPTCGAPHGTYPETVCTEPPHHHMPHAGPLIIDGRERGGAAWGPDHGTAPETSGRTETGATTANEQAAGVEAGDTGADTEDPERAPAHSGQPATDLNPRLRKAGDIIWAQRCSCGGQGITHLHADHHEPLAPAQVDPYAGRACPLCGDYVTGPCPECSADAIAAVTRVRAECDRIETAVRTNPTEPDFDGAYLACLRHIRTALAPPEPTGDGA